MPVLHCDDCHHEWEGNANTRCAWCSAAGHVIAPQTSVARMLAAADRRCRRCEYYDGGGTKPDGEPVSDWGDCLNRLSPRFQTGADDTCDHFTPDSSRDWPTSG